MNSVVFGLSALALALLPCEADAAFVLRRIVPELPRQASQMQEGAAAVAPIAYVRFCLHNSDQCGQTEHHGRIDLTLDTWATLKTVNAEINQRISPDPSKGAFDWSVTTTSGNCNDYAVQKRKALIEKGFPASALSLAVVLTSWGEGHLVLTARTDRGDFVLDSLRPAILAWDQTGYTFNRVQSIEDAQTWVSLGERERHRHFWAPRHHDEDGPSPVGGADFQATVGL